MFCIGNLSKGRLWLSHLLITLQDGYNKEVETLTQDVEKEGARTVEGKPIVVKRDTMLSNVMIMLM